MRRLAAALALLLGFVPSAWADCVDYRDYWHWTGRVALPATAWSQVVVENGLACVTTRYTGLSVVDVSNPYAPTIIGTLDTPGSALGIAKVGNDLLLADASNGLLTVDISNPSAPSIVNTWEPGIIRSVHVNGSVAFAGGGGAFYVLDISNVASPGLLGSVSIGAETYDIDVSGPLAVLAASDGVHVIDVSDAANPTQIGFLPKLYAPGAGDYAVAVRGSYAYVIEPQVYGGFEPYGALWVVDISNPAMPVGGYVEQYYGGAIDVVVRGSEIVVAAGFSTASYDLTDPAAPQLHETLYGDTGSGLAIADGFLYLAGYDLEIVDVSGSPTPPVVAESSSGGKDIAVSGHYAYSTSASGLHVLDVLNPRSPVPVTTVPGHPSRLDAQGTYLYVGFNGMTIYDITNPVSPVARGSVNPGTVADIEVQGDFAYVLGGGYISVVNVSDPLAPSIVRQIPYGWWDNLDLAGSRLYVPQGDYGVEIFDLSVPDSPVSVGRIDTPDWAYDVEVGGDTAYVANDNSVSLSNVADPAAVVPLATIPTPSPSGGFARLGDFLYVGGGEGLEILNVANPASTVYVSSHRTVGGGSIEVVGNVLYVCDGRSSISVIDPQCGTVSAVGPEPPARLLLGHPVPNPARGSVRIEYESPGPDPVTLAVFDVSGRYVRTLRTASGASGRNTVTWDGTDDAGQRTPSGLYFVRLQWRDQERVERIVRIQ